MWEGKVSSNETEKTAFLSMMVSQAMECSLFRKMSLLSLFLAMSIGVLSIEDASCRVTSEDNLHEPHAVQFGGHSKVIHEYFFVALCKNFPVDLLVLKPLLVLLQAHYVQ